MLTKLHRNQFSTYLENGTKLWPPSEWPHPPPKQTLEASDDRIAKTD